MAVVIYVWRWQIAILLAGNCPISANGCIVFQLAIETKEIALSAFLKIEKALEHLLADKSEQRGFSLSSNFSQVIRKFHVIACENQFSRNFLGSRWTSSSNPSAFRLEDFHG